MSGFSRTLESVTFDWDRDVRIGHLKGTVDSPTDRQRAEDVVQAAVGTTGRVLNELTVKGLNGHGKRPGD